MGGALGSVGTPGSRTTPRTTSRFQMNKTRIAPVVAPIRPAPWSSRYQPITWPMKVAKGADDPETGRQDEARGLVRPGRQEARNDTGEKAVTFDMAFSLGLVLGHNS